MQPPAANEGKDLITYGKWLHCNEEIQNKDTD